MAFQGLWWEAKETWFESHPSEQNIPQSYWLLSSVIKLYSSQETTVLIGRLGIQDLTHHITNLNPPLHTATNMHRIIILHGCELRSPSHKPFNVSSTLLAVGFEILNTCSDLNLYSLYAVKRRKCGKPTHGANMRNEILFFSLILRLEVLQKVERVLIRLSFLLRKENFVAVLCRRWKRCATPSF